MNSSTATCPTCEGHGVLYYGDYYGAVTGNESCHKCNGSGEVSTEDAERERKQYRKALAREVAFMNNLNPAALERVYVAGLSLHHLHGATIEVEVLENKSMFVERGPSDIYLRLATGERVKLAHYAGDDAGSDEGSRRRMSKYKAATYYDHVRTDTKTYETPEQIVSAWSRALGLEQVERAAA